MPTPEAPPVNLKRPAPSPTETARVTPQLLRILALAVGMVILCEAVREWLELPLLDWVPSAVTIVCSSLAAGLFAWEMLRREQCLHNRLRDAAQVRQQLEERERQLDEHNRQLEALTRQLAEESDRRRHTAEDLRDSEVRYRTLVEHAPECISVIDAATGQFVEVNSQGVELFGLTRAELYQTGPGALSPPYQPDGRTSEEAAQAWIQQALEGGTPVFEWLHRHPVRGDIPCEVRLVSMPSGQRILVRGSVTDISERKRIERALRRAHDELEPVMHLRTPDGQASV